MIPILKYLKNMQLKKVVFLILDGIHFIVIVILIGKFLIILEYPIFKNIKVINRY